MKLSIDSPCHENWDDMTPTDKGSFCLSCQKQVIDFSNKTLHDIKSFFKELPLTEKVCGRFESKQLEALSFDDFFTRFKKWKLVYKVSVICFFVFGMGLFSCTPKDADDQKLLGEVDAKYDTINKIPKVNDTIGQVPEVAPMSHQFLGSVALVPQDTGKQKHTKKPKHPETTQMIKGDIAVETDTGKVIKCQPDSLKIPGKIVGKIKLSK